jgi:hypothetical protein
MAAVHHGIAYDFIAAEILLLIRNFNDNRPPFGADADSMNRHLLMGTVIEKNVRQQIEPLIGRQVFVITNPLHQAIERCSHFRSSFRSERPLNEFRFDILILQEKREGLQGKACDDCPAS